MTDQARAPHPTPHARGARETIVELAGTAKLAFNAQVTRRHPMSLVHFVTRRCNARCSFCFIDFENPSPRSAEMTADEIDRMTTTVGPALTNVNLTGGEPFLRSDLIDIARSYYRNAGVSSVYITSNGAFTDRVADFADTVASEFADRMLIVSLSLDALGDAHDRIRKVPGLFGRTIETYHALESTGPGVMGNVAITVSHENHGSIPELYETLVQDHGVASVSAIVVRDEGVYEVPGKDRAAVLAAYKWLTGRIVEDQRRGVLRGYDPATLQGRLMNAKNEMLYEIIGDTYLEPHFVSTCHAGALFGVIDADAEVYPCEVLETSIGNLRDHDLDLSALWSAHEASAMRSWITDTDCHCSYECAWGFNILGNARYQPRLARAAIGR